MKKVREEEGKWQVTRVRKKYKHHFKVTDWHAWLAQLEDHVTLDPGVMRFEPHVRCRDYLRNK